MKVRVGTRGSELALVQTRQVIADLRAAHPDLEVVEVILSTPGDVDRTTPLSEQGGVGVFTNTLERALLADEVDLAVHSLKDLPTTLPDGLVIGAVPERASPWDAFICERYADPRDLPAGARVATGSLRRQAQLRHLHPHLEVVGIRGNIDTRLATYSEQADALILAAAGLVRTGRDAVIQTEFGPTEMTPAPGQGALGLEVRAADSELIARLGALDHAPTRRAVTAERAFLRALGGGCHLPIGALGTCRGEALVLTGMVATVDGSKRLQLAVEGKPADAEALANDLANKLRRAGGDAIIATYEGSVAPTGGDPASPNGE